MKFFNGRLSTRSRHGSDEQEKQGYGTLASSSEIVIDFDDDKKPEESTDSNDDDSSSSEESASFAGDSDDEETSMYAAIKEHTQKVARRFEHRENRGVVARSNSFDPDQVGAQLLSVSGHSRTRANKKPMVHAKSFDEDNHKSTALSQSNHSRGHARRAVRRMPRRSSVGPGTSCKDLIKDVPSNNGEKHHKSLASRPQGSSSELRHKRRSLKDSLHKRRTDRKVREQRVPMNPEEKERARNALLIDADLMAELERLADSDASEDEDEKTSSGFAETLKAETEEEELKMRRSSATRAPARRRSIGYEEQDTEAPKVNANPSLVGHFKSTQTKATDVEDASVGGHSRAARSLPAADGRRTQRAPRRRLSMGAGEQKMARNENMNLSLMDQVDSLVAEMYPEESAPSPEDAAVVGRRTQRAPRRMSMGAGEKRHKNTLDLSSHLESTAPNRDVEEASVGGHSRSAKTAPESSSREVPASRQMRRRASLGGALIREDEESSKPRGKKEKRMSIAKGSGHSRRKSPTKRRTSEHKSTKSPTLMDDNSAHIYMEHRGDENTSFLQFSIGSATAL